MITHPFLFVEKIHFSKGFYMPCVVVYEEGRLIGHSPKVISIDPINFFNSIAEDIETIVSTIFVVYGI